MDIQKKKQFNWKAISKAVLQGVIAGLFLGGAFISGYMYRDITEPVMPPVSDDAFALVDEADALLRGHYLYDLPDEVIREQGAVRGLVQSLEDPYTIYSEPATAEINSTNLAGQYGGIGVELERNEQGEYIITQVYRDNPAYDAGLQPGDIILAVDGINLNASAPDANEALAAIRGEVGTEVTLTLSHNGDDFDVTLERSEILVPSAFWRVLEEDQRIGYIQIVRFTHRTPDEVRLALDELNVENVDAYVLDLRYNTGGLVDSAVNVAGEFLDGGVVLYELRQQDREEVLSASRGGRAVDVPLAILVNDHTASAAEIVAGALRDRGRGVLIGRQTFGKGSVQVILTLSDGSSIRVTSAEWYTPDHYRIEGDGLIPDIEVIERDGQDADLEQAIEYLAELLK